MDYGVPEVQFLLNGLELPVVVSLEVAGDRAAPIGRAVVTLDRDVPGVAEAKEGDSVSIALGFRGANLFPVFAGRVGGVEPARLVTLTCFDRMHELARTRIHQAWLNADVREIVTWCMERAGVNAHDLVLSAAEPPRQHHFVAANETVLEVLRRITETWSLDWNYFADSAGKIYFLPWAEVPWAQGESMLTLEYAQNLTVLEPRSGGRGLAETLLAPWLRHSAWMTLSDERLWGRRNMAVRCERVTHLVDRKKGGRTRIEWTLLET